MSPLGKKVVPPKPDPGPEWVPCGHEREVNTRTGMKRTVIEKNEDANPMTPSQIFKGLVPDLPQFDSDYIL